MSYTMDAANGQDIIGRLVGDTRAHVAVSVVPDTRDFMPALSGYLLAVSVDGREYVTWAYGTHPTTGNVTTYWGTYHPVGCGGAHDAFTSATQDLSMRAHVLCDGSAADHKRLGCKCPDLSR